MHQHRIPEVVNVGQTIVHPQQPQQTQPGFIASLTSMIARSNVVKVRTEQQVMDRVMIVPLESGQVKISFFLMVSVKIVQEELGRMKPGFNLKTIELIQRLKVIVKIVQKGTKGTLTMIQWSDVTNAPKVDTNDKRGEINVPFAYLVGINRRTHNQHFVTNVPETNTAIKLNNRPVKFVTMKKHPL